MKLVFVCSPFAGDPERNIEKARGYCWFVMAQGHQPLAPHLHYPQFMDDTDPAHREQGLAFSRRLLALADELWVFTGGAPSRGMTAEIEFTRELAKPILYYNNRCKRIEEETICG